jgi:DNA replication protein DnaC
MHLHHPQLGALADEVYSFAQDVYHKPTEGRMLILYGANGCGKSHAARALKSWFDVVRVGIKPVVTMTDEGPEAMLPNCCYRMWPAVVDGFKRDQWLIADHLENEYLAILDDVGAEHDPSGFGRERLYLILSRRERRYTIITTNLSPEDWESKLERRIASRLFRNSTHINLSKVPDYNA